MAQKVPALQGLVEFFDGKKTFLVGLLMILLGLLQDNYEFALEGAGLIFLRLGVSKK